MKTTRDKLLTRSEYRKLLQAAKRSSERDYALLALAGNLGLRVGEAVALRVGDFHLKASPPYVLVHTLKRNGHLDDVTLPADLVPIVERRMRATAYGNPESWLFRSPSLREMHITTRAAQCIFKRTLHAAELNPRLSFHSLRHYRGTVLYQTTRNLAYVQAKLRHKRLRSTEVYVHSNPDLDRELERLVPTVL